MLTRLIGAAIAAVLIAPLAAFAQAAAKPNVVLIITDDVGYGDLGSYGAPDVKTPNIDRLARDGVRFTDFYAAPTCSPTRAALITRPLLPARAASSGRWASRVRRRRARAARHRAVAAATDEERRLRHRPGRQVAPRLQAGVQPERARLRLLLRASCRGLVDYYQHTDQHGKPDLYENDKPVQAEGYMTDLITERSVKFIDDHKERPFFLEVAYNAAHWPFQVPDKPSVAPNNARFVQPQDADTSTRADYVAILERADQGVGKILAALDRPGWRATRW